MSDERLLKDLARLARAQRAEGPAADWDRLASGELPPEEQARLRAEAEASPEAAAAWEAFQPLEADFRAALVERVQRELAQAAPAPVPRLAPRRGVPTWLRAGLWPALAAASLLLFLRPWSAPTALPTYELRLGGALRTERSAGPQAVVETSGPLPFAPGNRFELVLTPATSAGPQVEARMYVSRDRSLDELAAAPPERSNDGALRFTGVVGEDLRLPEGESTLLVVVGRPGALPDTRTLETRLAQGSPVREALWTAWKLRVRVAARP